MRKINVNGQIKHISDIAAQRLDDLAAEEGEMECDSHSQITHYWCTRKEGHTGAHVAHGSNTLAVWVDDKR